MNALPDSPVFTAGTPAPGSGSSSASAGPSTPQHRPPPPLVGGGGSVSGEMPYTTASPEAPTPYVTPEPPVPAGPDPASFGPRTGKVVGPDGQPVPGALIQTQATSLSADSQGRFSLGAPQGEEGVSISATGFVPASLYGWHAGDLDIRLQKEPVYPDITGSTYFDLFTSVVGPDGGPFAGADVFVTTPSGLISAPGRTGPDGKVSVRIVSMPADMGQATVWAMTRDADGVATRLGAVAAALRPPQSEPMTCDVCPRPQSSTMTAPAVRLTAPSGSVQLADRLDPPFEAFARWTLSAQGTGGAITIARSRIGRLDAPTFALPGITYVAEAEAVGTDGHSTSHWRVPAAPGDTIDPTFLRPPVPSVPLSWAPGAAWAWRASLPAGGYRLEWEGHQGGRFEAYSSLPRLTLPAQLPPGPGRVRLIAEGSPLREVARARQLRLFAPPTRHAVWQTEHL